MVAFLKDVEIVHCFQCLIFKTFMFCILICQDQLKYNLSSDMHVISESYYIWAGLSVWSLCITVFKVSENAFFTDVQTLSKGYKIDKGHMFNSVRSLIKATTFSILLWPAVTQWHLGYFCFPSQFINASGMSFCHHIWRFLRFKFLLVRHRRWITNIWSE